MSDSPPQRLTGWRGRLLNLGLLLAGLLFALLVAELSCRMLVGNPPDLLDKNDPVFGSRYRRGAKAVRVVDGQRIPVVINSDGFHSPELPRERTPGTRRVLFLGDSFTAATEVALPDTFPQQAASGLSRDGQPVEAVNLGISGFNTAQELLVWRTIGRNYQPDAVVLVFFAGNDVSDNMPQLAATHMPFFELAADGSLQALPFTPHWSRKPDWLRDSALYKWQKVVTNRAVRQAQQTQQVLPRYRVYQPPGSQVWESAWAVTEALVLAIRDEAAATGAPLLLVLIPEQIQVSDQAYRELLGAHPRMAAESWDLEYPHRRMRAFGERHGLPVLDALAPFRTAAQHQRLYNVEEFHCNAAGHRLLGRLIAERVASEDWL